MIPDPDYLLPWARERGMPQTDLTELCRQSKVVAAVTKSMLEEGRAAGLKGFEQVRGAVDGALGRCVGRGSGRGSTDLSRCMGWAAAVD